MGLWQNFKKWRNRPSFPIYRELGGYQAWKDKQPPRQSSWRGMLTCGVLVVVLVLVPCGGFAMYSASRGKSVASVPTVAPFPETTEVSTAEATADAELTAESTVEATLELTTEATGEATAALGATGNITIIPRVIVTAIGTPMPPVMTRQPDVARDPDSTQEVNSGNARIRIEAGRNVEVVVTSPPVEVRVTVPAPPPQIIVQTQVVVATNAPNVPTVTRNADYYASATAYFATVNPIWTMTVEAIWTQFAPTATATLPATSTDEQDVTAEASQPPVEVTATALDAATATPTETATEWPTVTPSETATDWPTEIPTATATTTPLPTNTPEPTWTPEPTFTLEPTWTPIPDDIDACGESEQPCSSGI
jgi:hypothetical protein